MSLIEMENILLEMASSNLLANEDQTIRILTEIFQKGKNRDDLLSSCSHSSFLVTLPAQFYQTYVRYHHVYIDGFDARKDVKSLRGIHVLVPLYEESCTLLPRHKILTPLKRI